MMTPVLTCMPRSRFGPAGLVTAEQLGKLLSDCGTSMDSCRIDQEFAKYDMAQTGKIGCAAPALETCMPPAM